jgi:hypothetical protein
MPGAPSYRLRGVDVNPHESQQADTARTMNEYLHETDQAATLCDRCGAPVRANSTRSPNARLLRRSLTADGVCAGCAATAFLKTMDLMASILAVTGPGILLTPTAQAQFGAVLKSGNADAKPEEIDWRRVVVHWDLPS